MLRRFGFLAAFLLLTMMLAACAQTGRCDMCGAEDVAVRELTAGDNAAMFCDTCYDVMKPLVDAANAAQ